MPVSPIRWYSSAVKRRRVVTAICTAFYVGAVQASQDDAVDRLAATQRDCSASDEPSALHARNLQGRAVVRGAGTAALGGLAPGDGMTDHDSARLSLPVSDRDHAQGAADAVVTLVEYGDYECPHCGRAYPIVQEAMSNRLWPPNCLCSISRLPPSILGTVLPASVDGVSRRMQ